MTAKIYFPGLDGLRTIACLMVFSWHTLGIGQNRLGIQNEYAERFFYAFLNGRTGVSIFFILSGFLISYLIFSEVIEKGKFNLGNFYLRRVFRIWPLYFAVILIVFVLFPVIDHFVSISRNSFDTRPIYYFTFLSNFDVLRIYETGGSDFLPSTITWSVAIEEQFYLFWPLLFFFIPFKQYKYIFILVIAATLLFRLSHYDQPNQLFFHSISAMFDLSVGGLAAYLCLYSIKLKTFIENMHYRWRIMLIISGLIIMYLNVLLRSSYVHVILTVVQVIFFAMLIMDQCFNKSPGLKLSNSRSLINFGKYTYGIYMLHPLALLAINIVIIRLFHLKGDNIAISFFVGLPFTIFLSRLSYLYIERRFLILKEKFSFVRG